MIRVTDRWATFDCYGTLIDWFGGVRSTLAQVWPSHNIGDLMATYHRLAYDDEVQADAPTQDDMLVMVAEAHDLGVPVGHGSAITESVRHWPAFPEVPAELHEVQARGWKMAILTNTDANGLISSLPKLGIAWDLLITVGEAGSLKPEPGHWKAFFERSGADAARHVHICASWFHDLRYTSANGMRAVWINRRGETPHLDCAAELPTLAGLADVLDRIESPWSGER